MAQMGRISGGVLQDNLLRQNDLNFKNEALDTALLHLDVSGRKIGIKSESPGDSLLVETTIQTTNLIENYFNIADISIDNSQLVSNNGNLNFNAFDKISLSKLRTDNIDINNNAISTYTTDTNLELRPNGSGKVEFYNTTNITGSLHATGNITFNDNLTLGDSDVDNVSFLADVSSDIVPDQTNTYKLGNKTRRYLDLYSDLLNGQRVVVNAVTLSDVSLSRRQGNTFYVSTLGDDNNVGDHQHGAFRTIKHALEFADASSEGPVNIFVYPGEYEEEFPLTIPERVSVTGEDIRNTIIKPTASTQTNDAFLMNQNSVVENITIIDFYSPGHAFRFAPNAAILERSPYIRNVTVLTSGSITSATDPRGFDAGDAGKGALVDGSDTDPITPTPSMLFHSCTFITPGVDAITMTNDVRIEWLNSFTYFANRGLYATQGTGRTLPDGSSLGFGAEIRSIGSASVYGNFGAVADGVNTLMYLIGHNFAYIGSGKNVTNDRTLTLQDQETQEINLGKIYYTATDADGTFRVGDAFFVNFEDGTTSIDTDNLDFSGLSSIFINTGGEITYIDGERIDLGNLRFSGNTIYSLDGDIIFSPSTEKFYLNSNPNFKIASGTDSQRPEEQSDMRYNTESNLFEGFSSGNLSFGGSYSDDRQTFITANNPEGDLVFFANSIETARISGNTINLEDSTGFNTGVVELNGLSNGEIYINDNLMATTNSNANLELLPDGNGIVELEKIYVYSNVLENTTNNNFSIAVTNEGYVKFDITTGITIPYGDTASAPANPEVGDTRWNTDLGILEVYNGTEYQRAAGIGEEVTEDVLKEVTDIYTLVLG